MKLIYLFLLFLLIPNASAVWYNSSYESKVVYNITNGCQYCVINITTPVTKSDRWVNESDNTPLSFWNESLTNVWVNLSSSGSYQISKYINNSNYYGSLSNSNTTFIQFHGISTTSFQDSLIKSIPYIYEGIVRRTSNGGVDQVPFGVSDMQNSELLTANATIIDQYYVISSDGINPNTVTAISPKWTQNIYYRIKIAVNETSVVFYPYGDLITKIIHTTDLPQGNLGLNSYRTSGTSEQNWSFIRNYNKTEPTYTYYATEYNLSSPCANKLFNYYYPSNVTLIYGTLISNGNLCSLYNIDDKYYRYEETVNPQGLLINITFNNVSEFKSILVNFEYTGTDTIFLQIYNYNINSFISVDSATNDMPSTNFNIEINNYLDYINNGTVIIRFNNPAHGNPIYNFNLNRILLLKNNFYPDSIYLKTNNILYKIENGNITFKTIISENITGNIINYLLDSFVILNTENFLYKINSSTGNIFFKINILNIETTTITNSYIYVKTKNNLLFTINKDTGEILYKTYILEDFEFMERRLI